MKEELIQLLAEISGDDTIINNPDIDLIESNILDSLTFINLISVLEDRYDIEIETTEIEYKVWTRVDGIVNMVKEMIAKNG